MATFGRSCGENTSVIVLLGAAVDPNEREVADALLLYDKVSKHDECSCSLKIKMQ